MERTLLERKLKSKRNDIYRVEIGDGLAIERQLSTETLYLFNTSRGTDDIIHLDWSLIPFLNWVEEHGFLGGGCNA